MSDKPRDRHLRRAPLPRGVKPDPKPGVADSLKLMAEYAKLVLQVESSRQEARAMRELAGVLALRLGAGEAVLVVPRSEVLALYEGRVFVMGLDKESGKFFLRIAPSEKREEATRQIEVAAARDGGTLQ